MSIKEALLELVNSEQTRYLYPAIEKLIIDMIDDYLKSQNKTLQVDSVKSLFDFDMILPKGIDDDDQITAAEIKLSKYGRISKRYLYELFDRFSYFRGDIHKVILIIVNEIPFSINIFLESQKKSLDYDLEVWDINKLAEILGHNEQLFFELYNNLNMLLLKETINLGISRNSTTYIDNRNKYIEQLRKQYEHDNVVLFLGAGASVDAKIATWDTLISELFISLVNKELGEKQPGKDELEVLKENFMKQNGNSPLLQTRLLKNGFKNDKDSDFREIVREILYKGAEDSSLLLEEIGQLCIPERGKLGILSIINYNFDDLVERTLKRLRVKYHSIYGEGMISKEVELGIYHVHGFLPLEKDDYDNLEKSQLVFSEEDYHKLMLDSYNWANISQLTYMMNNTCLFIGLSMTDPNLRRMLDIAAQKRAESDEESHHYAIIKRFKIDSKKKTTTLSYYENIYESLQESQFRELGVNVVWVDEFDEIPGILRQIKGEL